MPTTPSGYYLNIIGGTIEINDVVGVVQTDPVHDEDSGDWIRDIQIYREPDAGSDNAQLILTLRLKGEQKSMVQMHAPEQSY